MVLYNIDLNCNGEKGWMRVHERHDGLPLMSVIFYQSAASRPVHDQHLWGNSVMHWEDMTYVLYNYNIH